MIIRFNTGQLERERYDALARLLYELQQKNKSELDVSVVEFPKKFLVKLDDNVEMIIAWDGDKKMYSGLTEPQPEPEASPEPEPSAKEDEEHGTHVLSNETPSSPEPEPEPSSVLICCLDNDGNVISSGLEPDIDPIELARLKYELMSTHLNMPLEKKIIFNKEYARLWSEHIEKKIIFNKSETLE